MKPSGASELMLEIPIRHRQLRAPREDRSVLFDPPAEQATALLAANREKWKALEASGDALHQQLVRLAREARSELVDQAVAYTSTYRSVATLPDGNTAPILLSGHQPNLFHPGVWLKNFALSTLGKLTGGIAINLMVDNDTLRSASIAVPRETSSDAALDVPPQHDVTVAQVPIDTPSTEIPFEERRLQDRQLFDSFASRTEELLAPLLPQQADDAIVQRLWPYAVAAADRAGVDGRLGLILAEARHRFEQDLGLETLELPLSVVANFDSFREFALLILTSIESFQNVYNRSLAEYRKANRIRSRSHPVPDLVVDGDWLETPFWIWTSAAPLRRRLFMRRTARGIEFSDRASIREILPLERENYSASISAWKLLEARGIKIRPRALVTTMFARICLSDLFLHGIGGAKYDELTDALVRRYFRLDPPAYLTCTATTHLPVARDIDSPAKISQSIASLTNLMREIHYRGERFVLLPGREAPPESAELTALAREKMMVLEAGLAAGWNRTWHEKMVQLNRALAAGLAPRERQLAQERSQLVHALKESKVWKSREYSFVIFPSTILQEVLLDFCKRLS